MAGNRDGFQPNAAQVEDVTIFQRKSFDGTGDGHIIQARLDRQRPEHGAALGKSQAHFTVGVLIQQGNVRRVDVDLTVLEVCADVVYMAVGVYQGHRQVCQLPYESFQTAYTGQSVNEQRLFAALD